MKKYIVLFTTAMIFILSSCEKSLEELNVNPTTLSSVDLSLMLPEIIVQSAYNEGNAGNRAIGIIMQQLTGLDAQQVQYTNYVLGEDVMNNYWRTGLYAGVLRSCDVIIKQAEEEDRLFYAGVAKIIMANQYGIATSWFGDIPFSEAIKGVEFLKPQYDAQEQVYQGVLRLLDEGIDILSSGSGNALGYGTGDLIYNGDTELWIKTARALKARFLIHQAKRNNNAFSEALSELSNSYTSIAEQSDFQFGTAGTQNYSLAKFGLERPSTLGIHPQFAEMMTGDPRQPLYMKQDGDTWFYYDPGFAFSRNDATVPLISYAEIKFMEAEATLINGGNPADALKEAILANMEHVGVDSEDALIYANTIFEGEINLETIINEAYKSFYGYAFHTTWANFRRTGFPRLNPVPDGSNGFNPSGIIPRRFLYAESETQTNSANVAAARAAQNGALLDVDVWAFK